MNDASPPPRSRLVTILAWCFIAYSGFGLSVGLLQFILVSTLITPEALMELTTHGYFPQDLPAYAIFLFQHAQAVLAVLLVLQAATLVGSIALLKRRKWARIFFIVMLSLGIVWNIAGIFLQHYAMGAVVKLPPGTPSEFQVGFESMMIATQMISAVMAIALSALFAWLIRQLLSEAIKREFV